jgi:hypothetical protein
MIMRKRPPLAWLALGLLVALVATNVAFMILSRKAGPLIGVVFYGVLIWRWYRHKYQDGFVGGGIGLVVHLLEVIFAGWKDYAVLLALNIILPALLILVSGLIIRKTG